MKILTYVPLAPTTPRIYARTIQSLFRMRWDHPMPVVFGREDCPSESKYRNIVSKHEDARRMTLDGGYDALFLVENDMILPEDALEKLSAVDTDVAYGLYVNRHGWHKWLCYTYVDAYGGTSLSEDMERARRAWGQPFESRGVGMGCTLIHRHVLEALPFRYDETEAVSDDWLFSLDCIERGFRQTHHLGVACGHISKPQNPRILWPDPGAHDGVSVEFFDASQLQTVTPGETIAIPVSGFHTESVWGRTN